MVNESTREWVAREKWRLEFSLQIYFILSDHNTVLYIPAKSNTFVVVARNYFLPPFCLQRPVSGMRVTKIGVSVSKEIGAQIM